MAVVEGHGIDKGTAELNQPRYVRDDLTSKWTAENVCTGGEIMLLFTQETEGCGFLQG